jgi:hypothetical protein
MGEYFRLFYFFQRVMWGRREFIETENMEEENRKHQKK